jgi:hypothetical protein
VRRLSFTVIIAISIPWYTIQLLFLPPAPAKGRAASHTGPIALACARDRARRLRHTPHPN